MQTDVRLLRQVLIMTSIAIVGDTIGYRLIEDDWSIFDAFYMTFITLTTIGFSEVHSLSFAGRAFTIVLVTFGLGAAATFAATFARMLVEGDLSQYWRKRRMERMVNRLEDHVIVCGYGRIGQSICHELTAMGADCVVVESDESRQTEAREAGLAVVPGNATNDIALLSAGIGRAAAVVAALSHDTDNVFVVLSARDLNPDVVVVARAESRSLENRLLKAGVNRIVYPAQLGGGRIAHLVGEEIGLETESVEFRRATDVLGYNLNIYRNVSDGSQTLHEILEQTGAARVLALVRSDGARLADPPLATVVDEMEAVVLLMDTAESIELAPHKPALPRGPRGDLSVGVAAIDEEHQQILALIRRLENSDPDHDRRIIHEVLSDLMEYTTHHFHHEESIFLGTAYPDAEAHIAEHKAMVRKVQLMIEDEHSVHPTNLAHLLENWIVHHILEVDRGYMKYVQLQPN